MKEEHKSNKVLTGEGDDDAMFDWYAALQKIKHTATATGLFDLCSALIANFHINYLWIYHNFTHFHIQYIATLKVAVQIMHTARLRRVTLCCWLALKLVTLPSQ